MTSRLGPLLTHLDHLLNHPCGFLRSSTCHPRLALEPPFARKRSFTPSFANPFPPEPRVKSRTLASFAHLSPTPSFAPFDVQSSALPHAVRQCLLPFLAQQQRRLGLLLGCLMRQFILSLSFVILLLACFPLGTNASSSSVSFRAFLRSRHLQHLVNAPRLCSKIERRQDVLSRRPTIDQWTDGKRWAGEVVGSCSTTRIDDGARVADFSQTTIDG